MANTCHQLIARTVVPVLRREVQRYALQAPAGKPCRLHQALQRGARRTERCVRHRVRVQAGVLRRYITRAVLGWRQRHELPRRPQQNQTEWRARRLDSQQD